MEINSTIRWRNIANTFVRVIIFLLPADARDWGRAFAAELSAIETPLASFQWLLGGIMLITARSMESVLQQPGTSLRRFRRKHTRIRAGHSRSPHPSICYRFTPGSLRPHSLASRCAHGAANSHLRQYGIWMDAPHRRGADQKTRENS